MNSGVSTVHVAEQWRHGAEGEGEGEGEEEEGEGLVIPLLQGPPLFTVLQHGCNKSSPKLLLRLKPPGWKFY